MVLGTMGLEIIFSEGLLIDLKALTGPLRFQKRSRIANRYAGKRRMSKDLRVKLL